MVIPLDPNTALLAKHAQHVVLIHFPIALFISAVAFDFIAQWTKRRGMADTAYCPGFDCHLERRQVRLLLPAAPADDR
jgi:hypothetical protein